MDAIRHELGRLPPVTRFFLLGTIVVTLPCLLYIVSAGRYVWSWPYVLYRLQIWRFVTSFLIGPGGLNFLFHLYGIWAYLNQLETVFFQSRTADAAWGVGILCALVFGITRPMRLSVLSKPFMFAIMHLWAQTNPSGEVSLFGFINIRAVFLPFALLGIEALQEGPDVLPEGVAGILAGHIFLYLHETYPRTHGGRKLPALEAPQILKRYLGNGADRSAGGAARPTTSYAAAGGRAFPAPGRPQPRAGAAPGPGVSATGHRWGAGNRLG